MSNLRSDCRDLVSVLPEGNVYRSHIERLCHQTDQLEEWWHEANRRLVAIRDLLEKAVCTYEPDKGVVLLSDHGPTHKEVRGDREVVVYDHEHFSPLGDVLIAAWEKAQTSGP